jgi:hypothetical protein
MDGSKRLTAFLIGVARLAAELSVTTFWTFLRELSTGWLASSGDSGRRRSLFQTRHGHYRCPNGTERSCHSRVSGADGRHKRSQAKASHLRQRSAVLALPRFQRLV